MTTVVKKYIACYVGHAAAIAFLIISQTNHWSKWFPLFCLFFTAGLFIYLFWKNETLLREKKLLRMALLVLFFQLAALVFIFIKIREDRS
jgi:hypothetical protein